MPLYQAELDLGPLLAAMAGTGPAAPLDEDLVLVQVGGGFKSAQVHSVCCCTGPELLFSSLSDLLRMVF